ncbi:hypothetical protein [Photobacterium sanguinicancri]|uniref:hypothetical protein n=1 Tax=Photobacterium sanguinicancri TaxID=875932 RepID=UPI0024817C2A|nr:hypothetical protein [Photobacterium sanguinicancri]
MKFAKYWEKQDVNVDEKQFGQPIISVWGGSNTSSEDADHNAQKRVASLNAFMASDFTEKGDYEYWVGFVREELLEEVKAPDDTVLAVLTRNHYGALVLNTDVALFGDIDVTPPSFIERFLEKFGKTKKDKGYYLKKIEAYQAAHPDLSFRVYETHSGIRFIETSRVINSQDPIVTSLFKDLNVDPLYQYLCHRQACFRARLSPKPWRIGMARPASRFPRCNENEMTAFRLWLSGYEKASQGTTVVKHLASFGARRADATVQRVIELHDRHACLRSGTLA